MQRGKEGGVISLQPRPLAAGAVREAKPFRASLLTPFSRDLCMAGFPQVCWWGFNLLRQAKKAGGAGRDFYTCSPPRD